MEQLQLTIALDDGQALQALLRPEDERLWAEVFGDRSTIDLESSDSDVEGHAISGEVTIDVEGHAIAIRLPNSTDAAKLRRALAVGAVTATIVGAGAIAALQSPAAAPTTVVQAPAAENVRHVPAPALRAQEAESLRQGQILAVPSTISAQGEDIEVMTQGQILAVPSTISAQGEDIEVMTQGQILAVPSTIDADSPAVPAQAQHAQDTEMERQQ